MHYKINTLDCPVFSSFSEIPGHPCEQLNVITAASRFHETFLFFNLGVKEKGSQREVTGGQATLSYNHVVHSPDL